MQTNLSFHVLNNTTDAKGSKSLPVKTIVYKKPIISLMFSVLADGRKLTCTGSVASIQTEIKSAWELLCKPSTTKF
jgi:hypothetical protein